MFLLIRKEHQPLWPAYSGRLGNDHGQIFVKYSSNTRHMLVKFTSTNGQITGNRILGTIQLRENIGIPSSTSYKGKEGILYDEEMGRKIPRPIRLQVIRVWLDGKSRDKIAQELGISSGAVSGIIEDCRKDDPQFDLLREVAVKLKNQNLDIQSFAPLVRLYEVLREKGLLTNGQESLDMMQNRMEALIVASEVFCFKEHLSVEDLVSRVTNMYNTADNLGIPIQRFPSYITELKDRIDTLTMEMDRIEANKQAALRDYGKINLSLDKYRSMNDNWQMQSKRNVNANKS